MRVSFVLIYLTLTNQRIAKNERKDYSINISFSSRIFFKSCCYGDEEETIPEPLKSKFSGLLRGEKWIFKNANTNLVDSLIADGAFISEHFNFGDCPGYEALSRDFSFYQAENAIKIPHEFYIEGSGYVRFTTKAVDTPSLFGKNQYDLSSNTFEVSPDNNSVWQTPYGNYSSYFILKSIFSASGDTSTLYINIADGLIGYTFNTDTFKLVERY